MTTITPSNPLNIDFANILSIIQDYRSKAVQTINHASVMTAWHVGAYVSNKIKNAQWGSKVVQQLAEKFRAENGSLICAELLGLSTTAAHRDTQAEPRTDLYYKKRPCVEMVETAARIFANYLKENPNTDVIITTGLHITTDAIIAAVNSLNLVSNVVDVLLIQKYILLLLPVT